MHGPLLHDFDIACGVRGGSWMFHKADIARRRAEERLGKAYDRLRNLAGLADVSVTWDSSLVSGIRQESLPLIS